MTKNIKQQIHLHTIENMSCRQIATQMNMKKNTVLFNLRRYGVLKLALGRDIEERVAQWFEKKGLIVERQRGDAPFDLLIQGKKYDVKSANPTQESNKERYFFQLQCRKTRTSDKDLSLIDWFLLVFLGEVGKPMYLIKPADVTAKYNLAINFKLNKLPLQFIGFLEEKAG